MEYTLNRDYWYVCDFETTTDKTKYYQDNNDVCVLLACSINWNNEKETMFNNIEKWWDYHFNLGFSQTIWFHNLSWDGDYIVKYLTKIGFRISNNETIKDNEISIFRDGGKIYKIHVKYRKYFNGKQKKINIIFRCSLLILSASIESLGKSFGLKKHLESDGEDFYNREPKKCLCEWLKNENDKRFFEYCKNDTLIALKSLKNFENNINEMDIVKEYNAKMRKKKKPNLSIFRMLTAGAISKRICKIETQKLEYQLKMEEERFLSMSYENSKVFDNWFSGGYVEFNEEFNKHYQKVNNAIMVDVKSAYPYQMTKPLPYGELLQEKPNGDYYEFLEIKVKKAKIKKECYNVPILKNWKKLKNQRYFRELNDFTCFYIREEWEMIKKFYDIEIEYELSFYMKAYPFLKDVMLNIYQIKDKYDKLGDDARKMGAKILLNASYGKMCEKAEHDATFYFDSVLNVEDTINIDNIEYKVKHESKLYDINDFKCYSLAKIEPPKYASNRAAAVVITALQRVYLWSKIYEIGCKYFGISDTDSILFVNLPKDKYEKLNNESGCNLGNWEKENKEDIVFFGTYGAKKYCLLNENEKPIKLRFAGVHLSKENYKKFLDKYNWDLDVIEVEDATLAVEYCKSGKLLVNKNKIMKRGNI